MLTYQCCWVAVDRVPCQESIEQLYAAPEVSGISPTTVAADWWSFGVLLFELLSGEVSPVIKQADGSLNVAPYNNLCVLVCLLI